MRYLFIHLIKALSLICIIAATPLGADPVRIFAAASLRDVLNDVAQSTDQTIIASYAGSGTIARQIAAGAPADVIALADARWITWLADEGLVARHTITPIAANALVLIGPNGAPPLETSEDLAERLGTGRIAIGHHQAVPAGAYAQSWLEGRGLWTKLHPQLAETENVRAALAMVARGQAPLGIVYATDARASSQVATLFEIPPDQHRPITYFAAALSPEGARFLDQITSPKAALIFENHGFLKVTP